MPLPEQAPSVPLPLPANETSSPTSITADSPVTPMPELPASQAPGAPREDTLQTPLKAPEFILPQNVQDAGSPMDS